MLVEIATSMVQRNHQYLLDVARQIHHVRILTQLQVDEIDYIASGEPN